MPISIVEESEAPSVRGLVASLVADPLFVRSEARLGVMLAEARASDVLVTEFAADEAAILRMSTLACAADGIRSVSTMLPRWTPTT